MAKGLDATLTTAVGEDITRPYFLVEMDFDTPARYSTTDNVSWDSKTWTAAGVEVLPGPVIQIFNEGTTIGQTVLDDGTAGRAVVIYQGYLNDSAHPSPEMVFSGEMSDANIGEYVTIQCKQVAPNRTPRHYVVAPTFNHLPVAGTRFETPKGIITLEGN